MREEKEKKKNMGGQSSERAICEELRSRALLIIHRTRCFLTCALACSCWRKA